MKIIYPYNEILPTKKAHDLFIVTSCSALSSKGHKVTLLSGRGSKENLFHYYKIPKSPSFHHVTLPLIRKNNPFGLSWNWPFFWQCQRKIKRTKPDWVFLSVRKQGLYHLKRKIPGVKYLYEVHELAWYPGFVKDEKKIYREKEMLSCADQITVTTQALKTILLNPPYSLSTPISVVSLAVNASALPTPAIQTKPTLMYVGQLYKGQGLEMLLEALSRVEELQLKVVGGRAEDILQLSTYAKQLHIEERVQFLGFCPPSKLDKLVQCATAFVAPFENKGRMPFVAHTKLLEYASWGRPIIAPSTPIVKEHFSTGKGIILYEPDNLVDLCASLEKVKNKVLLAQLQEEMTSYAEQFSWEKRAAHYLAILQNK